MTKLNSLQDLNSVLPKKKRKHELYKVYEQVDLPQKNMTVRFLETWAPSKKEIQKLLDQNFDLTIKTLKDIQKKQLKEALLSLDTSDIVSDYVPSYSKNKDIINAKKIVDNAFVKVLDDLDEKDVKNFVNSVDLSKKMMEEKVYMWIVSNVNKDWLSVSLGNKFWHSVRYDIPYSNLSNFAKNKNFHKWMTVFVDVKKDHTKTSLVSRKDFDKQRFDEIKSMWIEIGWYRPIFYMTKSGKILKGKVVSLGDDVFGKQVIFETNKGKKFPVTLESLKIWMSLANKEYHKYKANFRNKKPIKVVSKIKEKIN